MNGPFSGDRDTEHDNGAGASAPNINLVASTFDNNEVLAPTDAMSGLTMPTMETTSKRRRKDSVEQQPELTVVEGHDVSVKCPRIETASSSQELLVGENSAAQDSDVATMEGEKMAVKDGGTDMGEIHITKAETENTASLLATGEETSASPQQDVAVSSRRWRAHEMVEDYVEFASQLMLAPISSPGTFGYCSTWTQEDGSGLSFPLEGISALGFLKSSLRRPAVWESWCPYEIASFEAAIAQYGKNFLKIQKSIETKTTKEIIDFYYVWKKTSHYQKWKQTYIPPHIEQQEIDAEAKEGEKQHASMSIRGSLTRR